MGRDPFASSAPDSGDVLGALDDGDCRTIIEQLDAPMTAGELSDACDIPQSTTYQKLGQLSDASLVEERVRLRVDGRHTTRYALGFDDVRITLDEERTIDVTVQHRTGTAAADSRQQR